MATSGSKSVTVTSHNTLKFSWSESSQSISDNTTTISWKMQLISDSYGAISSSASKDWKVVVNGKTYSGTNTVGISANTTKTLASGTTTISHNSDGTKTFSYSFSQEFGITFSGSSIGTKSGSGSGTLDTIPRTSTVSATSAYIGNQTTITINKKSSGFTSTLTYTFGSLSGTIATKTSSSSYKWTIPTSFYAQVTTAKSKSCTITCKTYNGDTSIGTTSCTFTVNVNESTNKPTLNPTVVDSNSTTVNLTGDSSKFIKYYSNANISIGASAKNSATIKSQKATCGSKSISTSTGTINAIESNKFAFTVTDSRGFVTTQTVTKTMINYVKLTCNIDNYNSNAEGNISFTIKGNYFNGNFGSASNTLTVQYRYKVNDGSFGSWNTVSYSLSGNTYSTDINLTGLDYQSKYTFEARAIDRLATISSASKDVKTVPVFDWGKGDFKFNVPVYANINGVSKKLFYSAGDSISFVDNGSIFSGFITSSTKNLHMIITLSKPVIANSVTVTGGMVGRGVKGYINGTALSEAEIKLSGASGYTVDCSIIENGIKVRFTFTNAIKNATNNTPVILVPSTNGMTIRFS